MNKPHPHNDIIEKKLEQLPVANAESLWNDMHLILDKKMPQKKERRRFIAWFLISKPFLLLTIGFIIGTGSTLFYLSRKDYNTTSVKTLPDTPQSNGTIEDGSTNNSKPTKGTRTNAGEVNQEAANKRSTIAPSANDVGLAVNNNFIALHTTEQYKRSMNNDPFNKVKVEFNEKADGFKEPVTLISPSGNNFDVFPVHLKSNYADLIAGNQVDERGFLILQPDPLPNKMKKQAANNNEHGLYTGVLSGIDLSSTNFKSVNTGSTKGFIVGYAFNNKWSIESGLLWDTKRIYDNGDHFNPPGYTPSSGITIIAVNGKSRLYELPVNVKYTIIPGEHRLFATTGLSSYLMRSENYDYQYLQNNQPGGHNYLSYKNETKNWLAVVNFSMGYSHKLGSLGTLRVEPYLKLPIKNLGVGKMPIMSTGLNIGFTKTVK